MPAAPYFASRQDGASNLPVPKLRVLIVDDDRDTTLTLSALLRDEGYETQAINSADEVMAALDEFDPDVLICDIVMPGISGWDLARQVRRGGHRDRPLLIAISGMYTKTADRLLSESVGFEHFFTKPCNPSVLLKVLEPLRPSRK